MTSRVHEDVSDHRPLDCTCRSSILFANNMIITVDLCESDSLIMGGLMWRQFHVMTSSYLVTEIGWLILAVDLWLDVFKGVDRYTVYLHLIFVVLVLNELCLAFRKQRSFGYDEFLERMATNKDLTARLLRALLVLVLLVQTARAQQGQYHFLYFAKRKVLYLDSNFTELCSWVPSWQ